MRAHSIVSAVRSAFGLIDKPSRCTIGLCIVGIAASESGMLVATWLLLKVVLNAAGWSEPLQNPGRLGLVLVAILAAMIVRTVFVTSLWGLIARRLAQVQQRRAGELFAVYLHRPYLELLSASRSQMLEQLRQVSRTFIQESLLPVLLFLNDALVAVAIIAVLMVMAPGPALLVAAWLAVVFSLIQRYVIRPIGALAPRRWAAFRAIAEFDEWSLQHTQSIRLQMDEPIVLARHQELAGEAASASARLTVAAMLPRYIAELALLSSTVVLFGWFAYRGNTSTTVLRELAIFTLAGMRLLPAGQRALVMVNAMEQGAPVRQAIVDGLAAHAPPGRVACEGRASPRLFEHDVALSGISFAYPGSPPVIAPGTTLTLRKGEWLHIKGPSGGGKSTLVALLLGFLQPDEGHIAIDGKPADPSECLRGPGVAIVAQDCRFLRGSVAENLAFPRPRSDLDDVRAVSLMRAMGLDFVLEANLGQDGAQLSGGQRQRLAIVRAMLTSPDLLVLDEATAQLDPGFERIVFDVIRHQLPDTTVVVVAHKLAGPLRFDRVWEKRDLSWGDDLCPEPV